MRISHIAMYVRDLEVVKEFYIRFFGAKAGELYHNPKTGLKSSAWSQLHRGPRPVDSVV